MRPPHAGLDRADDRKDAGELGAGHTVTALYEIVPVGASMAGTGRDLDSLKYQTVSLRSEATRTDEWLTVQLRYKEPTGAKSRLLSHVVRVREPIGEPEGDFRFATAVAGFGLVLRNSSYRGMATLDQVLALARGGRRGYGWGTGGVRQAGGVGAAAAPGRRRRERRARPLRRRRALAGVPAATPARPPSSLDRGRLRGQVLSYSAVLESVIPVPLGDVITDCLPGPVEVHFRGRLRVMLAQTGSGERTSSTRLPLTAVVMGAATHLGRSPHTLPLENLMPRPSSIRRALPGASVLRISHLVAAIGLQLLLAGCGEDTTPPSAPGADAAPKTAARVSASRADHARFQIRDRAANASFLTVDPSGCIETFVFVFGAQETVKEGPGKPSTGPLAVVQLTQLNFCTNEIGEFFGITGDVTFEVSTRLDQARLRATIPGFVADGEEVPAVVDLTWTGAGALFSQSDRSRLKVPGAMLTQWFKGTFRPAQVSGTVMIGDENIAATFLDALIIRARQGRFEVVRTR